ncbi:tRNA uridine-5-carboxymethylaminomethyl(34) synthesis GTPase MnmE, partial [archaeon]|nr:tRNA uridine-5-carboxymethylaminomethyl(34) synthesis GTPase MnmE [archaeon]
MVEETIYAESTPRGHGGISIIRISGIDTLRILRRITPHEQWSAHVQRPSSVRDISGRTWEKAMIVFHPSPGSY